MSKTMSRKRRLSTGSKSPVQLMVRRQTEIAAKKRAVAARKSSADALSYDVIRAVADKLVNSPAIHRLCNVNKTTQKIAYQTLGLAVTKGRVIDVATVAIDNNPIIRRFYDCEKKSDSKTFHDDVRKLLRVLEGMDKASDDKIVNLNVRSLGWLYDYADSEIRRCPPLVQKKLAGLMKHHFQRTDRFVYAKSLLRPSRFLKTIAHRYNTVTSLDLGDMKALKVLSLESTVFPFLENLEELVWHKAELWFIEALPSPHRLRHLCLTLCRGQHDAQTMSKLLNCQGLEKLYIGQPVPNHPTRFDMDVLLRGYQAFWNQRQYIPDEMMTEKGIEPISLSQLANQLDESADYALRAFPRLDNAAFWNAPEYLFAIMTKLDLSFETLQFGQLNQELSRLCSFDSIMQALFKFNQPKYDIYRLSVNHLKLFLHCMPVITLDYYLPQLLIGLGQGLPSIKSLDLFVHCSFDGSMPSSWSLEGRKKASKPKLEDLSHVAIHVDGFCLVDDLDLHLSTSLSSLSLSFIITPEKRRRFMSSLIRFIKHLSDINRFPDLEILNIQVMGIRCFEPILHCIVDNLSGLRELGILCMPCREVRENLVSLIETSMVKCNKLTSFALCPSMTELLITKPSVRETKARWNWRLCLAELRNDMPMISDQCALTVDVLPHTEGWNRYDVKPHYTEVSPDEEFQEFEEEDSSSENTDDSGEDEENSMTEFVDDDVVEESEDELDNLELKLENETNSRHGKWQKKNNRARFDSSGSEEPSSEGVVVFKRRKNGEVESEDDEDEEEPERNPLIDDEAVEASEDSDDPETEPEGEDLAGSDDEMMLDAAVELVNARPHKPQPKRRRIIDSDDE